MSELEHKIQSALRNKAGLAGLFDPMQKETDAVMGVIREELDTLVARVRELEEENQRLRDTAAVARDIAKKET